MLSFIEQLLCTSHYCRWFTHVTCFSFNIPVWDFVVLHQRDLFKFRVRVSCFKQESLGETLSQSQCSQIPAKEWWLLVCHLQEFSHFTPRLSFSFQCFRFPVSMCEPVRGWGVCVGGGVGVGGSFAHIWLNQPRARQAKKQQLISIHSGSQNLRLVLSHTESVVMDLVPLVA